MDKNDIRDFSELGGYPLYYIDIYGNTNCPDCARDYSEDIISVDANWEDESMYCSLCNKKIESAYGE